MGEWSGERRCAWDADPARQDFGRRGVPTTGAVEWSEATRSLISQQAIADTGFGHKVAGMLRVGIELLAQPGDVDVEVVIRRAVLPGPDALEEHLIGQHFI